jgi:endonuclease/exonuclease/phosphatase family metal-dependent hydrolase
MASNKQKRKKTGLLTRLALSANVLLALALLLCYLATYISPEKFWPVVFIGLAYPAVLLVNFLFFVFWLLKLKAWMFISLIAILLGINHATAYVKIFGKKDIPASGNSIHVMSFNVRYFDRYKLINKENEQTRDEIFGLIRDVSPDIVCFQEFYTDRTPVFNTLDSLAYQYDYPYYHTDFVLVKSGKRSYGTATFSKYPIINKNRYRFGNNIYNFAILTDIVVKTDTFRVFNVHFESIRLSHEDHFLINELTRQVKTQDETVAKYRQIASKIKTASILRASQSKEIRNMIEASPYPVILATDLNDTPASYAYRQLTANLNDAFVQSGSGLGNTYIGFLPAFRIDYILYDPFFESRAYRTIQDKLSDHYPVVTHLVY